ncbi:MAG: hypothetical protein NUV52_02080 [Candidatus Roizmanbacteria bacterium]|nr:hypothetical protein [Candidatus Roizmanbacteria bacterium]
MKTTLIFIAGILFTLAVGWGIMWVQKNNITPATVTEEKKISTPSPPTSPIPSISSAPTEQMGSIEGVLGYPSEQIPALDVYVQSTIKPSQFYMVETALNDGSFTISNVVPGTYYVFAYVHGPGESSVGGYSKAVPCGLTVQCNDHSLIPVDVAANEPSMGIEIRDWYAPEGTFPSRPQ